MVALAAACRRIETPLNGRSGGYEVTGRAPLIAIALAVCALPTHQDAAQPSDQRRPLGPGHTFVISDCGAKLRVETAGSERAEFDIPAQALVGIEGFRRRSQSQDPSGAAPMTFSGDVTVRVRWLADRLELELAGRLPRSSKEFLADAPIVLAFRDAAVELELHPSDPSLGCLK